jgi:(1->4)-alpha-D-glucan 1-alpha-D-glucosylmutase
MTLAAGSGPILATYRLQVHAGFPLSRARELVPYLARLGVTHLHLSPVLRARSGSTHGYDVVDPGQLNPALGDDEAFERLVATLRSNGLGLILDIVPNHMATAPENWRWEDVLTHGPASPYARWFDIEWRVGEPELHSRVLLPVLGDPRPLVLARGEICVVLVAGEVRVRYHEHAFPLDPSTWPFVLDDALAECAGELGPDHPGTRELRDVVDLLRRLPRRTARKAKTVERRRRQAAEGVRRLRELCVVAPEVRRRIERTAARFAVGSDGIERMRRLLDSQAYRLGFWQRAVRQVNYRRFFDVNDLVSLHMEDPEVFGRSHALVLDWIREGLVDGLRVDHVDGLLDPLGYLQRLAESAFPGRQGSATPVFVEKILSRGERLRDEWPVAGTTGYDFLNDVESVFIDPEGAAQLERDYRRIVRRHAGFMMAAFEGKRQVLETALFAGVRRLTDRLLRLTGLTRPSPTLPRHDLGRAIAETIVYLPVYRTYVDDRRGEIAPVDRALLEDAVAAARPGGRASMAAFDELAAALFGGGAESAPPDQDRNRRRFVQRFQQVSGPATAKGVEDTASYVHVPLLSRNEVGGAPGSPLTIARAGLHEGNAHRAACWPGTLLALTTHDTKRSADLRARLDVLSELPDEWEARVYRWRRWNRSHRAMTRGRRLPDANTEYLLYQTIVGAWPLEFLAQEPRAIPTDLLSAFHDRIAAYALKATREAKVETSWVEPNAEFETALERFVRSILDPSVAPAFLGDLNEFVGRIARPGLWNALGKLLLQLTAPGVPDLYQGDELWNFLLVDPDNRRPVDFDRRSAFLDELLSDFEDDAERPALLRGLVERPEDGRLKLHVVQRTLAIRRRMPGLFLEGSYEPLLADGPAADRLFGFLRRSGDATALVVIPIRIAGALMPGQLPPARWSWAGTRLRLPEVLARASWTNPLSLERVGAAEGGLDAADLFSTLPVALLITESAA